MGNQDRTLIDDHRDLLERLQREGNSITDDELFLIRNKLMEQWYLIRDFIPVEHKTLIGTILYEIDSLRGLK